VLGSSQLEARAGRLPALDVITLGAVCAVVLLVSLPCLQGFAVRENEGDARRLLPWLSQRLNRPEAAAAGLGLEQLLERRSAQATERGLDLRDAHLAADGRTLRHHGYLFALEPPDPQGLRAIVAWPLEHGRTGRTSFRFVPARGLLEHPDPEGRWSGARGPSAEELAAAQGWQPVGG